jgi:hypothetical protein
MHQICPVLLFRAVCMFCGLFIGNLLIVVVWTRSKTGAKASSKASCKEEMLSLLSSSQRRHRALRFLATH